MLSLTPQVVLWDGLGGKVLSVLYCGGSNSSDGANDTFAVASVEMASIHHHGKVGAKRLEGIRRGVVVAAGVGKVLAVSLLSAISVC